METLLNTVLVFLVGWMRAPGATIGSVELRNPVGMAQRWNCKGACACGAKTSALGVEYSVRGFITGAATDLRWSNVLVLEDGRAFVIDNGRAVLACSGCGKARFAMRISGKVNMSKTCNAKCEGACGPSCECSCGGKNHGASVSL